MQSCHIVGKRSQRKSPSPIFHNETITCTVTGCENSQSDTWCTVSSCATIGITISCFRYRLENAERRYGCLKKGTSLPLLPPNEDELDVVEEILDSKWFTTVDFKKYKMSGNRHFDILTFRLLSPSTWFSWRKIARPNATLYT